MPQGPAVREHGLHLPPKTPVSALGLAGRASIVTVKLSLALAITLPGIHLTLKRLPHHHRNDTCVYKFVVGTLPFHHPQIYAGSPPVHSGAKKAATNFINPQKHDRPITRVQIYLTTNHRLEYSNPCRGKNLNVTFPSQWSRWPHSHTSPPTTSPPTTIHHASQGRKERQRRGRPTITQGTHSTSMVELP